MLNHINIFLHYNILSTEKVCLSTNDIFDLAMMSLLPNWEDAFNEDVHSIMDLSANLKYCPNVQNILTKAISTNKLHKIAQTYDEELLPYHSQHTFMSLIKDHIHNDKALHIFITFDDAILAIIAPLLLDPKDDGVEETQVKVSKVTATPTRFPVVSPMTPINLSNDLHPMSSIPSTLVSQPPFSTTHSNITILDTIDAQNFLKADALKLHDKKDIQKWYKKLVSHGVTYGVFIVPWNMVSKLNFMRNNWMKTNIGVNKHKECDHTSVLIHQLLSSDEIFAKHSEALPEIVEAADNDGYLALYNILHLVHPFLSKEDVPARIHQQTAGLTFLQHDNNISQFLETVATLGCQYSAKEEKKLVFQTLHHQYHQCMLDKVEPKLHSDQVEHKLQLPCLGVTLNEWAKQLGLDLPTTPLPPPKIF